MSTTIFQRMSISYVNNGHNIMLNIFRKKRNSLNIISWYMYLVSQPVLNFIPFNWIVHHRLSHCLQERQWEIFNVEKEYFLSLVTLKMNHRNPMYRSRFFGIHLSSLIGITSWLIGITIWSSG